MKKIALVTGATAGFGQACAKLFAVNGYKIIITGRRETNLDKLKNELKDKTDVLSIKMDVRLKDKVFSQIENIPEEFSDIDVLVNNAGIADAEFSKVRFHGNQEKADNVYKNTLPLVAQDIAETVFWSVSRPAHVNINSIEIMPTCQAWGPFTINRTNKG